MEKYDEAKKYYMEALKHCKLESEKQDVLKELEDLRNVRLPASKEKKDIPKERTTTDNSFFKLISFSLLSSVLG